MDKNIVILFLVLGFALLLLSSNATQKNKNVLADAKWAGRREKIAAWRKAIAQSKNCKPGNTSLFLGNIPKNPKLTELEILLTGKSSTIPFANMQGSALIFGSPDVGKSATFNNRWIKHILKHQLGPLIVFDPKGDLIAANAPYAEACGYKSYFIAPNQPYSDSLNLFSLFEDRENMLATVTQQAAITAIRNTKSEDAGKSDGFFGPSGEALVRSVLMMAYYSPYKDLVMVKELLCAEDLGARVKELERQGELPWQVANSFRQFISGKSSDKTLGGIQATASLVFDTFVREEFFNTFIRNTTVPLDLTGKQVIFIQPMRGFEDVCMPVLSAYMELLIERNFANPRDNPLFVSLDEGHLSYLPSLMKWLAYLRSAGLVMMFLTQALSQLRQKYGQNNLDTILTSARTKIFMNPDDMATSEFVSNKVGSADKIYKVKSHSQGKGGNSTSFQRQAVRLISQQKVNSMKQGEFVYWNNANANKEEDGLPAKVKYKIPQSDLDLDENCTKFWHDRMKLRLIRERQPDLYTPEKMAKFFNERAKAIDVLFPLPDEEESNKDSVFKKEMSTAGILRYDLDTILPHPQSAICP